jgi:hypothetical protein
VRHLYPALGQTGRVSDLGKRQFLEVVNCKQFAVVDRQPIKRIEEPATELLASSVTTRTRTTADETINEEWRRMIINKLTVYLVNGASFVGEVVSVNEGESLASE